MEDNNSKYTQKDRLKSYQFNCPCCNEKHTRLFEYYAKFYGFIPEDRDIETVPNEKYMLERVVIDGGVETKRSMTVGDGVFRCGNCFEFFKFEDKTSQPIRILEKDKNLALTKFKPIVMLKEDAVMNSVAAFDSMINVNGCEYEAETGSIVIHGNDGKVFKFNIAEQLFQTFYGNNPMFDIKDNSKWGLEAQRVK